MITVTPSGKLYWKERTIKCALGRSGITHEKWEGDGCTPAGIFALQKVLYRPDRVSRPNTRLPLLEISEADGWCDDPEHKLYNMLVVLPIAASHEKLWREDSQYDIVVVLSHNQSPIIPYRGSAIFMHIATENYYATEGCVAIGLPDLKDVVSGCDPNEKIHIRSSE